MEQLLLTSHAVGSTAPPLIDDSIGRHFEAVARRFARREALVVRHQGLRFTYAELDAASSQLASALLRQGLAAGDRIGMSAPSGYEWVLMQLAAAKAAVVLVHMQPAWRASELDDFLKETGCQRLVATARGPGMLAFADLLASGEAGHPAVAAAAAGVQPGDPACIVFTSGTTGLPKAVTLAHRQVLNNGFFAGDAIRLTENDRVCVPLPLHHPFGLVLGTVACMAHGACLVIPSATFDPLVTLETVQKERCTALHGLPAMFSAQLAHPCFPDFDLASLRTGIIAGAPCPTELAREVTSRMRIRGLSIAYGMAESSPVTFLSTLDAPAELRVSTVGRVLPQLEAKVIDPESGATVPVGSTGELCIRGYAVMDAATVDGEGWLRTGDVASLDPRGYLTVVCRMQDMVHRGGEHIFPREVEELLLRHPGVAEVQVVGVPDVGHREELCACVVLNPGWRTTADDIRSFCRGRLANSKAPRHVKFVDRFPATPTGQVQKFLIRDRVRTELERVDCLT